MFLAGVQQDTFLDTCYISVITDTRACAEFGRILAIFLKM